VALFGGPGGAHRESTANFEGDRFDFDYDLVFGSDEQSFAALLPEMVQRASLFRPSWLAPGVYWALLVALLLGVPVLLARAARVAAGPQGDLRSAEPPRTTI
jgi:hypothetical protein